MGAPSASNCTQRLTRIIRPEAASAVVAARPWRQARSAASARAAAAAAAAAAHGTAATASGIPLPRVVPIAQQCKELRQKLCGEVLAGGLVWLWAGAAVPRNNDVFHPFRPASEFAYATGLAEPGWGCLLDVETGRLTLLAPRVPEELAIWSGPLPTLDDVASEAGADAAAYLEDLPAILGKRAAAARGGGGAAAPPLVHTLEGAAAAALEEHLGGAAVRATADFLASALARSRGHKTLAEIACLLEANRVSAAAHEALWAACRPGVKEYQLEAAFTASCMHSGLRSLGYPCIVGAGRNAGVLHYERNEATVQAGDLVLVDAGAEFRHYTADITRTFPAGGAFEGRALAAYQLTLAMQEAALGAIAPGADWKGDVEGPARRVMMEGLKGLGLVRGSVESMLEVGLDRIFSPHGYAHHLGLDVHDTSADGPVPKSPLAPGNVITCEPGLYIMPLLLSRARADPRQAGFLDGDALEAWEGLGGVRIEDNVALLPATAGAEAGAVLNLTTATGAAPKGVAEIEAVMAAARAAAAGSSSSPAVAAAAAVAAQR